MTAWQMAGILKGDKITVDGTKHYKVLGAKGNTLDLRPWHWWDTASRFLRIVFYRLTHLI